MLEIDRSFLEDLSTDPQADAVVRAIVELSHTMGLTVVAEGVETAEQLATLAGIGCDASQGFHLGRPAPASELRERLRRQSGANDGDAQPGSAVGQLRLCAG